MLKRGLGHTLFVLAVLTFCAASAAADSRARIVRLSFVEGNVQMDQRDGRGLQKAFLNMPIGQGTILLTRDQARAEIEFENGSTIRIARDSQLEFQQLGLRTAGTKFSAIDVSEGTLYFDIKKKGEDEFVVTVNGQQITAPKSARFRLRAGKDGTNVAVFKGEVDLDTGGGKQVEVRKGESLELDRSDASRYFLAREITTDPLDAWDLEREKYRDQYFAASTYAYNPGYSYGYADLAYWGNYEVVPVYGRVWRPYFVGLTWQPYADGSWVWYPGAGYVWVSAYPWGWAPYRYGSWVFVGSRGWCWRPAVTYVSWVTVPVYYNAPVHFIPPRFPVDRRHHEPILIGNGGPGPVHPGGDGRGRWYRDDDREHGGGHDQAGKQVGFNGPDVRPMPHDNPNNGEGSGGKKQVSTGPDVRPMPHEGKGNDEVGKKDGGNGPDVRPAPQDGPNKGNDVVGKKEGGRGPDAQPGKREDLDAREARENGGGKKQVFSGPDVRPMPHANPGDDDHGGRKEASIAPDAPPLPHDRVTGGSGDADVREQQGSKRQVYSGPDAQPMRRESPAGDNSVRREVYSPDVRPMPRGQVGNDSGPAGGGYGSGGAAPSGGGSSSGGGRSAPVYVAPSGGGHASGGGSGPSSGGSGPSYGGSAPSGGGGMGNGGGGGHSSSGPSAPASSTNSGSSARSGSNGQASTHRH